MASHKQGFRVGLKLTGEFTPYALGTCTDSVTLSETPVGNAHQRVGDSVGFVETDAGGLFMQGLDDDIAFYEIIEGLSIRGPITLYISDPRYFSGTYSGVQPPPTFQHGDFVKPRQGNKRAYPKQWIPPTFNPYGITKQGTSSWFTLASHAAGIDNSNDYTVALWVWMEGTAAARRIWSSKNTGGTGLELVVGNGSLVSVIRDGANVAQLGTDANVQASVWTHVTTSFRRAASIMVMYINGTLVGTKDYSAVTGPVFSGIDIMFGKSV